MRDTAKQQLKRLRPPVEKLVLCASETQYPGKLRKCIKREHRYSLQVMPNGKAGRSGLCRVWRHDIAWTEVYVMDQ
jgi:hypothetical protein